MIQPACAERSLPPALLRLSRLAPLEDGAIAALNYAASQCQQTRARRDLVIEGQEISQPRLIVSGWAARVRLICDGRRQLMSFLLPGDLIGMCQQSHPLSVSSVMALTTVRTCTPPLACDFPSLAEAYAVSAALEEAYLLAQITRLGRLSAQERIADFFLELHERLSMAGLVANGTFDMPLTQEMLGDTLGLTSVHINRMLQQARQEGDIALKGGQLTLFNAPALARIIGRKPYVVSARPGDPRRMNAPPEELGSRLQA